MKRPIAALLRGAGVLALATAALLAPSVTAQADTATHQPTLPQTAEATSAKHLKPAPVPHEIRSKTKATPRCYKLATGTGSLLCISAAPREPVTVWYDNKAATQTVRLGVQSTSESAWRVGSPVLAPVNQVTGARWTGLANGCYRGLLFLAGDSIPYVTPGGPCVG